MEWMRGKAGAKDCPGTVGDTSGADGPDTECGAAPGAGQSFSWLDILDNAPSPLYVRDASHRWVYVNHAYCGFLGRCREDLLGRTPREVFCSQPADLAEATDLTVLSTGEPLEYEASFVDALQQDRWMLVSKRPGRDREGRPTIIGVLSDMTGRKAAERQIVESERIHRSLLDKSPLGVLVIQTNPWRILLTNDTAVQITGRSRKTILGCSMNEGLAIFHPDDRDRVMRHFLARMTGQVADSRYECRILRPDGEVRWLEVVGALISGGPSPVSQGLFRDITVRKAMEEALSRAKEQAEAASRAKSDFLANMSHEIRTPLNAIWGMLHMIKTTQDPREKEEYLTLGLDACGHLVEMVNDLFDFSRIDAGAFVLDPAAFDPGELLRTSVEPFREQAVHKGLRLTCVSDPGLPGTLWGDGGRIGQILRHLLENAVKFTSRGEVRVECRVTPGRTGPGLVDLLFLVSDTGIGIPEDKRDKVLSPFTQGESTWTKKHQGAGMGLNLARGLAELMGGGLLFESEPGSGSTFAVHLPLAEQALGESREALETAGRPVFQDGLNILLVFGPGPDLRAAKLVLRAMGHTPSEAGSGSKALALIGNLRLDCALVESRLFLEDQGELMTTLRARRQGQDRGGLPVVAVGGGDGVADREACLRLGADGFLVGPGDMAGLGAVLDGLAPGP